MEAVPVAIALEGSLGDIVGFQVDISEGSPAAISVDSPAAED